jgi:hypothetical protein
MNQNFGWVCDINCSENKYVFELCIKTFKDIRHVSTPFFKECKRKTHFEIAKVIFGKIEKDIVDNSCCLAEIINKEDFNLIIEDFTSNPSIYRELLNEEEKALFKNTGTKLFNFAIDYFLNFHRISHIVAFVSGSLYSKQQIENKDKEYLLLSEEEIFEKFKKLGIDASQNSLYLNRGYLIGIENNLLLAKKFFRNKLGFKVLCDEDPDEIVMILSI